MYRMCSLCDTRKCSRNTCSGPKLYSRSACECFFWEGFSSSATVSGLDIASWNTIYTVETLEPVVPGVRPHTSKRSVVGLQPVAIKLLDEEG